MSTEKIEKLCELILRDLDSVRFDIHDIEVALKAKEGKEDDLMDLEFGIDITNRLMADMKKITGGINQMKDLLMNKPNPQPGAPPQQGPPPQQ